MKTTKPISTISYNSREFLEYTLENLVKARKLAFWAFVPHKAEDDEGGKKDHFHVFAEPAVSVQTEDLREAFREIVPGDKPLGCMPFQKSKFSEWYLYGLHDEAYLASKQQTRRFHYSHDEMVSSDADYLLCQVRLIDRFSISPYASMVDAMKQGVTLNEFIARGLVPIQQVLQFTAAWNAISASVMKGETNRNGRDGHDLTVGDDPEPVPDPVPAVTPSFREDDGETTFRMLENGTLQVVNIETGEILAEYEITPKNG